jgi:hypothetical protein
MNQIINTTFLCLLFLRRMKTLYYSHFGTRLRGWETEHRASSEPLLVSCNIYEGAPPSQTTIIHILNNMGGGPFSFKHGLNLETLQ